MKKTYIMPAASLMEAEVEQMLAGSVTSEDPNINIGYGGVDTNGSLNPEAKESDWAIWQD